MAFGFRRIANNKKIIEELDGLRFVAILFVIVIHIFGIWTTKSCINYQFTNLDNTLFAFIKLGLYGVELFFVISGFILAIPFLKAIKAGTTFPSKKKFYLRRLTRLEPPYILSTLAFFLMLTFWGNYSFKELTPNLIATLGYVHNFIFGTGSLINKAAWSLEIEIQFYLLAPFVIPFLFKCIHKNWYISLLICLVYPLLLFQLIPYSQTGLYRFLHFFIFGVIWAYVYVFKNFLKSYKSYFPDLFVIVSTITSALLISHYKETFIWVIPIWVNVLFIACFTGKIFNAFLKIPFVSIVGGMCYSIYLLHGRLISLPIIILKNHINTGSFTMDMVILIVLLTPFILLISSIFYLLIERPCMNPEWYKHLYPRRK